MAFTSGQWGPDTFVDSAGNTELIGATVSAVGYVCVVDAFGNLTVTGPATDSLTVSVTPASGAVFTATIKVPPLVTELDTVRGLAVAAETVAGATAKANAAQAAAVAAAATAASSTYETFTGAQTKATTAKTEALAAAALLYVPEVSVAQYGAVGNGTTDDTAAVLAAQTALPASGGVVLFPRGKTYRLTGNIATGTKSVVFRGEGKGSVVTFEGSMSFQLDAAGSGVEQMTVNGCRIFVNVADCHVTDVFSVGGVSDGAVKIAGDRALVSRCTFTSGNGPHVRIYSTASDCRIRDNHMISMGTSLSSAIQLDTAGSRSRNIIESNTILDAGRAGIEAGNSAGTKVLNNYIVDTRGTLGGISLAACSDSVVQGNYIETAGTYGIEIDAGAGSANRCRVVNNDIKGTPSLSGIELNAQGTANMTEIEVTGNRITATTATASTSAIRSTGTSGKGVVDSIISGNTIKNAFRWGINLGNCTRVTLSGNRITYTSGTDGNVGIVVGGAQYCVISFNIIQVSTAAAAQCMSMVTAAAYNTISGNVFDGGSVLTRLLDTGADTPSYCILTSNVFLNAASNAFRVAAASVGWVIAGNVCQQSASLPTAYRINGQGEGFGPADWVGTGSPAGVVVGRTGATFRRTDGAAGSSFYVKQSGLNDSAGWAAIA